MFFWCSLFSNSDLILGVGSLSYILGKDTLNRPYLSLTTSTLQGSCSLELSFSSTAVNLRHLALQVYIGSCWPDRVVHLTLHLAVWI